MNIKLTPYPVTKAPKNKWFLEVRFMSGDADAYATEQYEFETQEEFISVYNFFNKCLAFKRKRHNLMIDLWNKHKSKSKCIEECENAENKYKLYGYTGEELQRHVDAAKQTKQYLNDLLGDFDGIFSWLDAIRKEINYEIEIPSDVTTDHQYSASIDDIEDMYYYDKDGVKYKINIS